MRWPCLTGVGPGGFARGRSAAAADGGGAPRHQRVVWAALALRGGSGRPRDRGAGGKGERPPDQEQVGLVASSEQSGSKHDHRADAVTSNQYSFSYRDRRVADDSVKPRPATDEHKVMDFVRVIRILCAVLYQEPQPARHFALVN